MLEPPLTANASIAAQTRTEAVELSQLAHEISTQVADKVNFLMGELTSTADADSAEPITGGAIGEINKSLVAIRASLQTIAQSIGRL